MFTKFMTATSIVAALAILPAQNAKADAGDLIGGLIIGGIIGHAVTQGNQRSAAATQAARPSIPATQQGRETQTALNYFGFNAGTVDGQVGPGTRAAIERYQGSMGFPVNGREFSSYQFDFLMDAYYWATTGGAGQTGLTNVSLLYAYRDNVQNRGTMAAVAPQPPATVVITPQAAAPATMAAASTPAAPTTMPNLFANAQPSPSLANTCNGVMLQTSTNGGYVTQASMTDPGFALAEQFCVARTYAMAEGEELMGAIVGLTQDQITAQCGDFTTMLSAQIDRVSVTATEMLLPEIRQFAQSTGIPPAELSATSRVCLSVGYAQDDMRMAVGSALMLVALGEDAYGELVGHHLRQGFGTTTRADLAMGWYEASLSALESGAQPVFMPGQPERVALIRAAVGRIGNATQAVPAPVPAPVPAALPTFSVQQQQ